MKWNHDYMCKAGGYLTTISFKIKVGTKVYGHYEEYTPESKYKMLRRLVLTKHSLISAFYNELEHYTNIAKYSPTEENISKVKELADALLKKGVLDDI